MKSAKAPFVTGVRSMKKAPSSTSCATSSLSYAQGSSVAPRTNEPPSTRISSGAVGDVPVRALVSNRVLDLGPELEGLQHRLLVLQLVLEHQPEDECLSEQGAWAVELGVLERLQDALANVGRVRPRGLGSEGRELWPAVSRVAERRQDLAVRVEHRRLSVEVAEEPELLEVRDARELPHERQLERRNVLGEPLVRDRRQERVGACSGPIEGGLDLDNRFHIPGLCTMVASSTRA